jgi:hypothetical protein
MNEKNEGEGKKKTFNLMVQGDDIILAKLSNLKSNHKSKQNKKP